MTRIKRARPALVVAVLALIAAVAGTALAGPGPDANTAGAAKTAKKALKKAKKALKKANANATLLDELCGPGASAAGSETCTAPQGPKGDTGDAGPRGPSNVRVASASSVAAATCNSTDLGTCANLLPLTLGAGNWLVQAKLNIDNEDASPGAVGNVCGLAQGTTELDEVRHSLAAQNGVNQGEAIALAAVLSDVADGTTVAVRCNEPTAEILRGEDIRITALQVETVG